MLRCCRRDERTGSFCGGAVGHGVGGQEQQWPRETWRWRLRRRNRRRRRRRRQPSDSSVAATADVRRQKYRRVSGRTSSSFELSADDGRVTVAGDYAVTVVDPTRSLSSTSSSSVGLADCWRRVLTISVAENSARHRVRDDYGDDDDGGGSSSPPPARLRRGVQRSAGPVALSNWTMISDSSLRDADCDDLHEELFGRGYIEISPAITSTAANIPATTAHFNDNAVVRIVVNDDYYY